MLIAKVVQHIRDYIKAVQLYGPKFYAIPFNEEHPYHGLTWENRRAETRIRNLLYGRLAYKYIFSDDDDDFAFIPVCKSLGFNSCAFRRKLQNLTKKEAKVMYALFLRGSEKIKYVKAMKRKR